MTSPIKSAPVARVQPPRIEPLPTPAVPTLHGGTAPVAPVPYVASSILSGYTRWNVHRLQSVDGAVARDVRIRLQAHTYTVRVWETRRGGALPTVVILHGMGGMAATHRPLFNALSARCRRAVFLEIPGHGESDAVGQHTGPKPVRPYHCAERISRLVQRTLDEVLRDDTDVVLLGHSLGGYLAMRYAREGALRARLCGLVLVSPDGGPYSPQALEQARRDADIGDALANAHAMAQHIWPGHPYKAWTMAPFLQATYAQPAIRYLLNSDLFAPTLLPSQLRTLPKCCLVWGRAEQMQLPQHLNYFRTHLPQGTVVTQPAGLGHGDAPDAPETLMQPIYAFLADCGRNRPYQTASQS